MLVMHFFAVTTVIFSCSHYCLLVERKNSSLAKVSRLFNIFLLYSFMTKNRFLSIKGLCQCSLVKQENEILCLS